VAHRARLGGTARPAESFRAPLVAGPECLARPRQAALRVNLGVVPQPQLKWIHGELDGQLVLSNMIGKWFNLKVAFDAPTVTATIYVTLNLIADVLYVLVNPRLRA